MSLLTPSESFALQAFLNQIDYDAGSEWGMYTKDSNKRADEDHPMKIPSAQRTLSSTSNDDDDDEDTVMRIPRAPGTDQLRKATMDLMSLDNNPSRWCESADRDIPRAAVPQRPSRPPGAVQPRAVVSSGPDPSTASSSLPKRPHVQDAPSEPSKRHRPTPTPVTVPSVSTTSSKPALLSPSQKKANHIQSEQKRRANIRRGYEALCETVPALREAIRLEEESQAAAAAVSGGMNQGGRVKRRTRNKKSENDGSGEKIDGRAGPRSENVVLQKTIDYVQQLLSEKDTLLARLHRARCTLGSGHPALTPQSNGIPVWERKWTGGTGIDLDDLDGESNDGDD